MTTEPRKTHAIDLNALNRADKNSPEPFDTCISVQNLNLYYGAKQALHDVTMEMPRKKVTAYIGPSGCGPSLCRAPETSLPPIRSRTFEKDARASWR